MSQKILVLGTLISFLAQVGPASPAAAQGDQPDSWLYLRDGQPLAEQENPLEIVAVGDIMLGRSVQANSQTLAQAAPWLIRADLALGNFEGVLAPPGKDPQELSKIIPGKPYHLVMTRQAPGLLQTAGFDLLSLANNHALDLKTAGLEDTLVALESAGLDVIGVSPEPGADPPALIREIKGVKIAFLAFSMISTPYRPTTGPVPAQYDPGQSAAAVQAARQQADMVIVNLHWGIEYQTRPDPAQISAAENLFTAGADLILGHHPHVVQGSTILPALNPQAQGRRRGSGFVAYSLGNFVFDQFKDETLQGLALRVYIDQDGLRAVQALPIRAATRPRLLTTQESAYVLARLQPASQTTIGFVCDNTTCERDQASKTAQGGLFDTGQIDLTGDGQPETIRLADGAITISEAGKIAWRSPPEWQVLDLALGDPNDDGRAELLISLRKADSQGLLRSQPYIVGYRGGIYKLLWGGSALSTPITEIELGDVDGDGAEELVVLEEQAGATCSVNVLNWHGWGFVLLWRSEAGYYQDLRLNPDDQNQKVNIQISLFTPDHGEKKNERSQ